MSLQTPFCKGKTYGSFIEIRDANGFWFFDCYVQDADELLKLINRPLEKTDSKESGKEQK